MRIIFAFPVDDVTDVTICRTSSSSKDRYQDYSGRFYEESFRKNTRFVKPITHDRVIVIAVGC
jgi:hypothetical protein